MKLILLCFLGCLTLSFSSPTETKLISSTSALFNTGAKSKDVIGYSDDKCVYGNREATLVNSFWLYGVVSIQGAMIFLAVLFLGGSVLALFFSLPGALGAIPIAEILVNEWVLKSEYWKVIGPGEAYQRGYSANKMVFYLNLVAIITSTIMIWGACVYTSFLSFNNEREVWPEGLIYIRVVCGCLLTFGLSIYTAHFLLTEGVPSYYRGEWGDVFNGIDCSGPYSYRQLGPAALIVEFSPILGMFVPKDPLPAYLFNGIRFISSLFVIFGGYNVYHTLTATFTAALTAIPTILFIFILYNVSTGNVHAQPFALEPSETPIQPSYQPIY